MSIKVTAQVRKQSFVDTRTKSRTYHAELSISSDTGKGVETKRNFTGFEELADALKREAGVPHQILQERFPLYEKGEPVTLRLTFENPEQLRNLGFDPADLLESE